MTDSWMRIYYFSCHVYFFFWYLKSIERYLVSQLPGEGGISYVTRDAAISALGEIESLQLVSVERLQEEEGPFEIQIKASLDIEELPLPLKPIAYLFPSWKLSSGWTKWPLEP